MFRRKGEDSLFDTPSDQPQGSNAAVETTTTTTPSTSTASATPASSTVTTSTAPSSVMSSSSTPAPSATTARPMSEPRSDVRSSSAPTANAFRPNTAAPMGGDVSRNRMPEAKPVTTPTGMGLEKSAKAGRRVLTVGNDILLKGEIATCDRLVIEGKVDATLNDVHTVEIAETGSFKGSANIEDAEISGLFEGDLVVRNRLVIYATGKVRGKISYGEIEIERGGELTGEIKTTSPISTSSTRPTRAGVKADDKVAA